MFRSTIRASAHMGKPPSAWPISTSRSACRRSSGRSEIDRFVGTGLEEINNDSARDTVDVTDTRALLGKAEPAK